MEVVFLPQFVFVKETGIGVSGHFCSSLHLFIAKKFSEKYQLKPKYVKNYLESFMLISL